MEKRLNQQQIGLKVLAFVIACFLWLFVVNISDPVITKTFRNITVEVTNQEVLAETSKTYSVDSKYEKVDVVISAKRRVLSNIHKSDISAIADLSELGFDGDYQIPIIPIEISVKNYDDEITSAKAVPQNLQVSLEEEETKTFAISPVVKDEEKVAENYVLGNMSVNPETITIRGAKSKVADISYVVAPVDVEGLSKSAKISTEVVLYDEDNNLIENANLDLGTIGKKGVDVDVEVLPTKKVSLEFDTSEIGTASGYYVSDVKAEPNTIQVAGARKTLASLDKIVIPSKVLKCSNLKSKTEQTIDVSPYIEKYDVKLADSTTASVLVTIVVSKNGTQTFEASLGNISVSGLATDYTMEYEDSNALEMQIQGPNRILDTLDLSEALSIDLSEYRAAGTYTVPVNVDLPAGCYLINNIQVKITIKKKG